ncbi:MAG: ZIP family metal transporter [Eubacteriales bacterium]|nr:ZIP family metal transporter [Eubacteriales bacterium]
MVWSVLAATLSGVVGTGLGGALGALGGQSKNAGASILAFTAGLMTAVLCFELIPEAVLMADSTTMALGVLLGAGAVWVASRAAPQAEGWDRMGFAVFVAIMLHNLPEGLAIGSGWAAYPQLGMRLAITIALHDLPEGMAISGSLRQTGGSLMRRMGKGAALAALSGVPTALGAALGQGVGALSATWVSLSLGFAAGAMLYVCTGEMLPSIYRMPGRHSWLWQLVGFGAGLYLAFA